MGIFGPCTTLAGLMATATTVFVVNNALQEGMLPDGPNTFNATTSLYDVSVTTTFGEVGIKGSSQAASWFAAISVGAFTHVVGGCIDWLYSSWCNSRGSGSESASIVGGHPPNYNTTRGATPPA